MMQAALSHAQRMGRIEKLERQESQDLGLRVLIGKRQAMVSGTVLDRASGTKSAEELATWIQDTLATSA